MRSTYLATIASIAAGVAAQDDTPSGPTMSGTPLHCNAWYTVVSGDSCPSVEEKFGITADQFFRWNPTVSTDCTQNFWVGNSYCVGVGPPKSTSSQAGTASKTSSMSTTTHSSSSAKTTSTADNTEPYSTRFPITSQTIITPTSPTAWPPTKTQAGEPSGCNNWHYVVPGDTCQMIVNQYGNTLTLKDFMAWNPAIRSDCSALFNGFYVCIGVKPTTSSSFDWFNAPNTTIPSPTSWEPAVLPTINSTFNAQPQRSGIPSTCQNFWKAGSGNTCKDALAAYPYITQDQFFKWNPSINNDCNGLWADYWYCVADYSSTALPQPPTQTTAGSPKGSGTVSGCKAWYEATDGDTCDIIVQAFGSFSKSDFIKWNPSVSQDCSTIKDDTYYCVGVAGTPTTRTDSISSSTTPTSLPTQSGTISSCDSYWLVSDGDDCKSVENQAGVSDDQFQEWNTGVGSGDSCKLTANKYVCVGVKS